jgi:hypothetical protein
MSKQKQLTPIQQKAIELLLLGHPIIAVAAATETHRNTVASWLNDDRFSAELRTQQNALFQSALGLMLAHVDAAIGNVIQLATVAEDEAIRLKASTVLIDRLLALRQQTDIEQRLERIESQIKQQN